eukprot:TRINITY_DN2136_c0_g2_i1.p1 TRINITY_DN2136_c0_g2~~TRINITY_DN2136_c0_g2_i1.p1  ORF type:complete len:403 (+),score=80.14 TRINITY_DN2136_c0_g2_i1:1184-2392(+)
MSEAADRPSMVVKKRQKRKRNADDKARIEAAMRVLQDAKDRADVEKKEYQKYLQWKVRMQRKERKQRAKEEDTQRIQMQDRLRSMLNDHKVQRSLDQKQWREYAASKVTTAPPPSMDRPSLGEFMYEEHRARKREAKLQRQAASASVTQNSSAIPNAPKVAQIPNYVAIQSSQSISWDNISYEDFQRAACEEYTQRRVPGTSTSDELVIQCCEKMKQVREKRASKVHTMCTLAAFRRNLAMEKMAKDPPADCIVSTDILKYLPPEFLEEEEFKSLVPKKDTSDGFFLTEVSEDQVQHPPPGRSKTQQQRRRMSRLNGGSYWSWMPKLPVPMPPLSENPESARRRRQERERKQLEEYLLEASRGYNRVSNRTEYHGKHHKWTRHERHSLPVARPHTIAITNGT